MQETPVIPTLSVDFHLPTELLPAYGTVPAWELWFKYLQITCVKDHKSVPPFGCWVAVSNFVEIFLLGSTAESLRTLQGVK